MLSYASNVAGSGTALTVDVLNSTGALLAPNVGSGTDLSTLPAVVAAPGIELRANLSTSNSANTPDLNSWSVSYYGNSFSAWSSLVSSTQGTAPVITSDPPPATAAVGTAYNFTFQASGFPTPTFAVTSGGLPPGLTLSPIGVISGTPTSPGSFTAIITATNSTGTVATETITMPTWGLVILAISIMVVASKLLPRNGQSSNA